ncbi:DUF4844 domain-containing protein [Ideonella sp. B508-1]|uniref:DUF4844 domain-containing protein n=1 Tax=Ideonella sp. B508-1 TaxID=137716 RepID=UPI0003B6C02F|nr:DUF4844 domain-containing protein [Ideonella sp. B508-1]
MTYDPISDIVDEPLIVLPSVVKALAEYRALPKIDLLPGVDTTAERGRLAELVNGLTDQLLAGVAEHPSKLWVMQKFQGALLQLEDHDTEAREHFGMELERLMGILGIESSDGLLSFYLGGL